MRTVIVAMVACVACGSVHADDDAGSIPQSTGAACKAGDGGPLPALPACDDAGSDGNEVCAGWWTSVGGSTLLAATCLKGACVLRPSPPTCTAGNVGDSACAAYFQEVLGASAVADARCDSHGQCQTGTQCFYNPQTNANDLCDCFGTVCPDGLVCADKRCQPVCTTTP